MKATTKTMLAVLWAGVTAFALNVHAQDAGGPPQGGPGGQGGGPGGMGGRRPPPSPVIEALDANHDGVIDADEIANASAALKKLDKNGDGKLTPDELRPQRPQGMRGPGQGQGGPDQQGQGRGPGQGHGPGQGQEGQLPPPDGAPPTQ